MVSIIPNKVEMLKAGSFQFTGAIDDAIKLVQEKQLKDVLFWRLFVEQYRKGNVDDADNGWRGEYWGKMMRGASLTYMYTQDEELYKILEDTVYDLLSTQDTLGRFSTYSVSNEFREWDVWSRKYILLGSLYFMDVCKNDDLKEKLLSALIKHADYILSKVGSEEGKIPITRTSRFWDGLNSSSILEPFVRLYILTGYERYLRFAEHIIECGGTNGFNIFKAALENKLFPYQFPVTKAYEMISNFEGILWYYRVTGNSDYLAAAINFADKVFESDITVIGSAGCTHELFDHSVINQFDPAYDGIMQETCVTVTWMKFCYQLLQITGNQKYADWIEVSVYNALLGALNTEDVERINMKPVFDSYSPLRKGARGKATGGLKSIGENTFYGCCLAIGAAGTALAALGSIGRTSIGFSISSYIPGMVLSLTPNGSDITFQIKTEYPTDDSIEISLILPEGTQEEFTIDFRLPPYGNGSKLAINGEQFQQSAVTRLWSNGDHISISTDNRIRLLKDTDILPEAIERKSRYGVLLQGPLVLARDSRFCDYIDKVIHLNTDDKGFLLNQHEHTKDSNTLVTYNVVTDEGNIKFADYSSCGKAWDDSLPMAAWILIK